MLQLTGEYGLRLRQRGHLPKVRHLGGGSGHMQSQPDWPPNASFNSVSVGTPALVPSDSVLRAWPCSGTLTERLPWTRGSRSAHVVPKTKPGGGTVSPIDPGLKHRQASLAPGWLCPTRQPTGPRAEGEETCGLTGKRRGRAPCINTEHSCPGPRAALPTSLVPGMKWLQCARLFLARQSHTIRS